MPASKELRVSIRRLLADGLTPVAAFAALVGERSRGFIFESVDQQGSWARFSFVGRSPLARIELSNGTVTVDGQVPVHPFSGEGLFGYLERLVPTLGGADFGELPFAAGLVGYVGYDTVREIEPSVPLTVTDDTGFPDAVLYLAGEVVVFDHWTQSVTLVVSHLGEPEKAEIRLDALAAALAMPERLGCSPWPEIVPDEEASLLGTDFISSYCERVVAGKSHIIDGDIFQVVLGHRFDFLLQAPRLDVYRALRVTNPSPYMYLIQDDLVSVIGSSPEALVTVTDGKVMTRPIAGTSPRGDDPLEDDKIVARLLEDPKELAEHVMLVDLARNDLGRVSSFGSCEVVERMVPERFARVIHLTSTVVGALRKGVGPIDVLRATLPAGTLSGAPKVRAMQIIDDLEVTKRSIYGGVVGYIAANGSMDFAIAIRTIVVGNDGMAHLQAGAGIVADSDPKGEARECVAKASAVARAVIAARKLRQVSPPR